MAQESSSLQQRILSRSTSIEDIKSGYQRKYGSEDPNSAVWINRKKHLFILSSSGKPIYSRYGDEAKLSSLMGVIQAIVSFYESENDSLSCIESGSHRFVFSLKGPIYLVSVSSTAESEERVNTTFGKIITNLKTVSSHLHLPNPFRYPQLRNQLEILYNQLLFTLTHTQLHSIFTAHANYDLRNLLTGTELFTDRLAKLFKSDCGILLGSYMVLPAPLKLKAALWDVMMGKSNGGSGNGGVVLLPPPKSMVFGLVLCRDKLVHMIRPHPHLVLRPQDLLLIINMINSSSSFRSAEAWAPLCLPFFNPTGFVYAYISFLPPSSSSSSCITLLSVDKNAFFELSEYNSRLVSALQMHTVDYSNCGGGDREEEDDVGGGGADDHDNNARANSTTQITNNNKNNSGGGSGGGSSLLDELEEAARLSNPSYHLIKVGIPSLRHFVFRYKSIGQHTEPAPAAPYSNKEDFARLVKAYDYAYRKLNSRQHVAELYTAVQSSSSSNSPTSAASGIGKRKQTAMVSTTTGASIVYFSNEYETVFACKTSHFEIYAALSPFISKQNTLAAIGSLQKWIKRNEDLLFIPNI